MRHKKGGGVGEAIPWIALFGGVGLIGYLVLKPSTQANVAKSILSDPTKAAKVPGTTEAEKYDWIVKSGTALLQSIGVLPGAAPVTATAPTGTTLPPGAFGPV